MPRDDFSGEVKRTLALRVNHHCSNPGCRAYTSGPHSDPEKSVNVGVAAHMSAASPGGKRYNPALSAVERRGIDNAIWLCQLCAWLIDSDEARFTMAVLRHWKQNAEEEARSLMGRTTPAASSKLQAKCREYLPHLPVKQKEILSLLNEKPVELKSIDTIVRALEEQKFIECAVRTDTYKGLYRLNADIAPIVKAFFAEERRRQISAYLDGADQDEHAFLMLLASPAPTERDQPEHPRMSHEVYRAALRLVDKGILIEETSRPSTEKVRLAPDAMLIVEEKIIKGKVQRDSITLDWNNIAASGKGGGGAPPQTWARAL